MRGILLTCALAVSVPALAQQAYPEKPIRMIVISAPGGTTDLLSRAVGKALTESMGQTIVLDNRPGGGGIIASEMLVHAPPDGYTILMSNTSHSVLPSLHAKLPYDPIKDFAPVSLVALTHSLLLVNPSLPVKSMKELLDLAKAQPGKLAFGSGSAGSMLPGFMLEQMAHVKLTHVPYKSIPPALTDTIGGQIPMCFADLATGTPQIKSGKVRALGVTSQKRAALLPDVPAIAETVRGFELIAWFALFTNAGVPADIIERLHAESVKILARNDVKERYAALGVEVAPTSSAELGAYVKSEIAKWAKLVKAAGIQPE